MEIQFHRSALANRSHTTRIYDHGDSILFTTDRSGNYHVRVNATTCRGTPPDCTPTGKILEYHRDNLVWLRYVAPEKVQASLDAIFGNRISEEPVQFTAIRLRWRTSIPTEPDCSTK